MEPLEYLAYQVLLEILDHKDHKAPREQQDSVELKVVLGPAVLLDPLDLRVLLGHLEHLAR
jgi:hypothetical protein